MTDKKFNIWLDGECLWLKEKELKSLSPGFVKGRGVFETMRVCDGEVLALSLHLKRMRKGLKILNINSPYPFVKIKERTEEILRRNALKNARLRVMIWKNKGETHCSIFVRGFVKKDDRRIKGWHAVVVSSRRNKTKTSFIKSIDYHQFYKAGEQARRQGYDEALLLNRYGHLVEGSRTNIFILKDQVLYTPSLASGCLEGITRGIVLRLAKKMKVPCKTGRVTLAQLLSADEAFVTNSLEGIVPLLSVNGSAIGSGRAGPVTKDLRIRYLRSFTHR